jgi:hypothetical protein
MLLGIGTLLLFALLTAAVIVSPRISARVAPVEPHWTPSTAMRTHGRLWRTRTWSSILTLGYFLIPYLVGQAAGFALAEVMPYVSDNPAFTEGGDESRWIIHYPQYWIQALVIYLFATLGVAWYADRVRSRAVTSS